ncbi:MAG: hypothetical protein ABIG28_00885, partial [archaeon]
VDGDSNPTDFDGDNIVDPEAGMTRTVNVRFTATDADDNLDDADATAQLSRDGVNRPAIPVSCTCTSGCATDTRTYDCLNIDMQYYDDNANDWTATVSIDDTLGAVASVGTTQAFTFSLLRDIVFTGGTPINFPTVSPGGSNYESLVDLTMRNDANYDATAVADGGDGDVMVTAFDLVGVTIPADTIPAVNFDASDGSSDPCAGATTLGAAQQQVTDVILTKGDGTGTGSIAFCLTSVPGAINSQVYQAIGGNQWVIELE